MANQSVITLKINTVVNGQKQVADVVVGLKELDRATKAVQASANSLRFDQVVTACAGLQYSVQNLVSSMSAATEEYKSFKNAMHAANTMAGLRGEDFEKLKDQVTELSKTIPLAREALANGLYQVISNGVPEDNWISYLEASAKSAVGGIADVGEVVKVTSTIIKNYGLSWEAAQDIQDKIQLTAKNGVTSFEQLAAALPSVTGQAAQLGVSIDEMMATMSTLTGVTGNTSEVATQLASVLTALTKESTKAQKMAAAMGIEFNAASIKAAGGFQYFLKDLDAAVTAYADKTGELKESIYSKLFGRAEALRLVNALTGELSAKMNANIAEMKNSAGTIGEAFDEMVNTSESKAQLLHNKYAEVFDAIGKYAAKIQPALNFSATLMITISGITALSSAIKALIATSAIASVKMKGLALITQVLGVNARSTSVLALRLRSFLNLTSNAAKICAVSIRGILVASGVGIAIVALSYALEGLCGVIGKAKAQMDEQTAAQQRAAEVSEHCRQVLEQHATAEEDLNKAAENYAAEELVRLDMLYKAAMDEAKSKDERTKAIKRMQEMYPSYFGNISTELGDLSSLTTAYKNLRQSILDAADARASFERLVEIEKELNSLDNQEVELRETLESQQVDVEKAEGKLHTAASNVGKYPQGNASTAALFSPTTVNSTAARAAYDTAVDAYNVTNEAINTVQNTREKLMKERARLAPKAAQYDQNNPGGPKAPSYTPSGGGSGSSGKGHTTNINETDEEKAAKISISEVLSRDLKTIADYNKAISDLELKVKYVGEDQIQLYNESTEALKKERDAFMGVKTEAEKAADVDVAKVMGQQRTSIADCDKALEQLQLRQKYANAEEAQSIEANIKLINEEREAFTRIKPAAIDKLNTQKGLSEALSYYESLQQSQTGKEWWSTQKTIDALREKLNTYDKIADVQQRLANLADMMALPARELKAELKNLGFEGLTKQIREMEKALKDLKLSPELEKQLKDNIATLKKWRKESVQGFDTYREGYGAIKGAGNAIIQTTETLKGNGTAWEKTTAAIDGALSIMEGVESVIEIINMIKTVTEGATAATTAAAMASTAAGTAEVASAGEVAAANAVKEASSKSLIGTLAEQIVAEYMAAHAEIPFAGFAIGSGFSSGALSMIKAAGLMKFAKGGIAYGPTVGLFGEYAGARSNPEVVAPLDKLRSLIGADGGGYPDRVRIWGRGRDLEGVIKKHERRLSR